MIPGTILYTKDGRDIGNAIILERKTYNIPFYPCFAYTYKVKTDFGNVIWLTDNEIKTLFYDYSGWFTLRYRSNISKWILAKAKLFFKFND